ncbi:MAG: EamA family transporter [Candidatus Binataceae bacterium]|nr:EamA family transporter [Candidatus Binataceae bacterium]
MKTNQRTESKGGFPLRSARNQYSSGLLVLLGGLTLAWGFNFTAMKVALSEIPPLTFRSICLFFGALTLFALLRLRGQRLILPKHQWGRLIILAISNITCFHILLVFGLTMIPSGRVAILAFTMPVWATILSVWILGDHLSVRKVAGLALGLAGIVLLLGEGIVSLRAAPVGAVLVLVGAFCWGFGTVLQKRYPVDMPISSYTAWIMLLGSVPMIIGAWLFENPRALLDVTFWPGMALLYNVVIAFAFAQWAWLKLAILLPVSVSSLSTLMVPVVGVFSGMLFLNERPSWTEYGALVMVLGSLISVIMPSGAKQADVGLR